MLCLKAQFVEDNPRASRFQAGVFLPINLSDYTTSHPLLLLLLLLISLLDMCVCRPSSIHRYLRKNGRGGSHPSFSSSEDGSGTPSGLEVSPFFCLLFFISWSLVNIVHFHNCFLTLFNLLPFKIIPFFNHMPLCSFSITSSVSFFHREAKEKIY